MKILKMANSVHSRFYKGDARIKSMLKAMFILAMGTASAKLLALLSIPILTRIYSPHEYGLLALYTAVVMMVYPLMSLRYAQAIPLPLSKSAALHLFYLSFFLSIIFSVLLSVFFYFIFNSFPEILVDSFKELNQFLAFIILGCLASSIYEMLSFWAIRNKEFKVVARTQFSQSLLGESTKIALGTLGFKSTGLIIGQFISQSQGIGLFLIRFRDDIFSNINKLKAKKIFVVFRKYKDFPIYRLPSHFLLIASTHLPIIIVANLYNPSEAGQLSLAFMAIALPVSLIGDSLSKVFYTEIAGIGKNKPDLIRKLTLSVVRRLFLFSLIPALGLYFLSPYLFSKLFGEQWAQGGVYASILSIILVSQFIQKPVSFVMFVFDGQKTLLAINLQRIILISLVFGLCHYFDTTLTQALWAYTICLSAHYIASIVIVINKIPRSKEV